MRLQAQPPARMREAIRERGRRVVREPGPVHGLQEEMIEAERLESLRLGAVLGKDELELVALAEAERRTGLRAYADPVESRGRILRAVGLYGNRESARMQRLYERGVQLEEGFA